MIRLVPVDQSNYADCLKLKVADHQKSFVAANVYSLAQAYVFNKVARPLVIYSGDVMVGFAMLEIDPEKNDFFLWRFMIDERHQGKGYGRAALRQIIDLFKAEGAKKIGLSYEPDNQVAETLYRSCGFLQTGEMDGDEIVMALTL